MIDINDYSAIAESIAKTIAAVSKPLTEDQKIVLAGALGVWLKAASDAVTDAKEGN